MDSNPETSDWHGRRRGAGPVQKAEFALAVTKDAGIAAKAKLTQVGLLAIAALVSSIVLSTAVLVQVAVKGARRFDLRD